MTASTPASRAVPGQVLVADSLFDDVTDLHDLAGRLARAALWVRELAQDGWTIEEPEVLDGFVTLVDPDGNVLCAQCRTTPIPARGIGECGDCTGEA